MTPGHIAYKYNYNVVKIKSNGANGWQLPLAQIIGANENADHHFDHNCRQ